MNTVTLAHTEDRTAGVRAALAALNLDAGHNPIKGRQILLKPNFNTADPVPGSTDNQTLLALIDELWRLGASSITVGERSWQSTARVIEDKGVAPLLAAKDVGLIVFDDLPEADWIEVKEPGHHWPDGFRVARAGPRGRSPGRNLLPQDPPVWRRVHPVPQAGRGGRARPAADASVHEHPARLAPPAVDDRRDQHRLHP